MKEVTIPNSMNPYEVTVNNNTYSYPAGEIAEVPDEVAEVIQHNIDSVPKPALSSGNKLSQLATRTIAEVTADDLVGVTSIPKYMFEGCASLKKVEIPSSVTNIEYHAFVDCTSLEKVILRPDTPPVIQPGIFNGCPSACRYAVPRESLEQYKTAENWSTIASRMITIEE